MFTFTCTENVLVFRREQPKRKKHSGLRQMVS